MKMLRIKYKVTVYFMMTMTFLIFIYYKKTSKPFIIYYVVGGTNMVVQRSRTWDTMAPAGSNLRPRHHVHTVSLAMDR
jgi:hypothetical protein